MEIIRSVSEMQGRMLALRREGACRIGFVPTMGCLHEGHLSLVREVCRRRHIPVVSIFVNPLQFGPREDLARYPRPFDDDCRLCLAEGVQYLFAPSAETMYPPGNAVFVEETDLSARLCGASRPGHFRGVTTVVAKLFHIVQPHLAVFGRKDAQQARIIQAMVASLNMPIEIVVAPIVREPDGLAMSSRNRYLSPAQRGQALCLVESLREAARLIEAGRRDRESLLGAVRQAIGTRGEAVIDYVELVDWSTLRPVQDAGPDSMLAMAVRIGETRLIDNLVINSAGRPDL